MRFKPNTTVEDVQNICDELAGTPPGNDSDSTGRFSGQCMFNPAATLASVASVQDATALAEPFQTFQVASANDLLAMRSTLGDTVSYIERDRVASITVVSTVPISGDGATIDSVSSIPWG